MNVILIAVDTMRARSLCCYGYAKPTSSNIDLLAEQGVLFEHSCAHAHNTHPGYATMFTGAYPITHRVVRMNGEYWLEEDRFVMLTEALRGAGFATAAVTNLPTTGWSAKATWIAKGFQTLLNYNELGADKSQKRLAAVNDHAFAVMKDLRPPFFVFLHAWDTHTPYMPQPPYDTMWVEGDPTGRTNLGAGKGGVEQTAVGRHKPGMADPDPEDVTYTIAQYDGCVSEADAALGELLGFLDDAGLADDTLIVFTSDHGENMAEHEMYFVHRWAYEDCIAVPIIFRWPAGLPQGRRVAELAQHVDLAPTILDLAGVPVPGTMEGMSLARVLRGEADSTYEYARMHATFPDVRRAVRTRRHKFIKHMTGSPVEEDWPRRELFDLQADPGEVENLVDREPAIAEGLEAEMNRWVAEKLAASGRVDPLIEQARQSHIKYDN